LTENSFYDNFVTHPVYSKLEKFQPTLFYSIEYQMIIPLIINFWNFFSSRSLFQPPCIKCREPKISSQRISPLQSTKNRNRILKYKEQFLKVNCIWMDAFIWNIYFNNLCFLFSTPFISFQTLSIPIIGTLECPSVYFTASMGNLWPTSQMWSAVSLYSAH